MSNGPAAGVPRVVVLRALGLGDLLTAVPALRGLRAAWPRHRLVLAAPAPLQPLVSYVGGIDELADVDFTDSPPTATALTRTPALRGADVAVNLHGRGPASHRALQATRPRRLLAFAAPPAHVQGPAWTADEHEVDRWCRLMAAEGIHADPCDLRLDVPPAPRPAGTRLTVLHPGAASPARRWPAPRWAQVARCCRDQGDEVAVTGSPSEEALAHEVAAAAGLPPEAVRAGRTSLDDLAHLVAAADRLVSGDTGVAHLATATATSSVVLFGPVAPDRWGPRVDRDRHRALWAGLRGDPHGRRPFEGLLRLQPADVVAALQQLPARGEIDGAGRRHPADPEGRSEGDPPSRRALFH